MPDLIVQTANLPPSSPAAVAKVDKLEQALLATPQFDLQMQHVLHAGLYSRTVLVPAGIVITGALVKIPTQIMVSGDCVVWLDNESRRLTGYHIMAAAAGRKQAFVALADTYITMMFATSARTVAEAENEFTDDAHRLASRRDTARNDVVTGEAR